jgi:hypothetical protein
VNTEALTALRERIRNEPKQIRLCCPRGHFIITVELIVLPPEERASAEWHAQAVQQGWAFDDQDQFWIMHGVGRHHHRDERLIREKTEQIGNPDFTVKVTPRGLTATLTCRRCPHWVLTRDHQRLAAELAVHALAGHREHRLSK